MNSLVRTNNRKLQVHLPWGWSQHNEVCTRGFSCTNSQPSCTWLKVMDDYNRNLFCLPKHHIRICRSSCDLCATHIWNLLSSIFCATPVILPKNRHHKLFDKMIPSKWQQWARNSIFNFETLFPDFQERSEESDLRPSCDPKHIQNVPSKMRSEMFMGHWNTNENLDEWSSQAFFLSFLGWWICKLITGLNGCCTSD